MNNTNFSDTSTAKSKKRRKKGKAYAERRKVAVFAAVLILIVTGIIISVILLSKPSSGGFNLSDPSIVLENNLNEDKVSDSDLDISFESGEPITYEEDEEETSVVLAYNADTREGYMNNVVFLGDPWKERGGCHVRDRIG